MELVGCPREAGPDGNSRNGSRMTSVLIHKPTIVNGLWAEVPFILTKTLAGWSDRPLINSPAPKKEAAK